jgi:hypothetical protein
LLRCIVYSLTDAPWANNSPEPKALTEDNLDCIESAQLAAIERCKKAGCDSELTSFSLDNLHLRCMLSVDFIEIH